LRFVFKHPANYAKYKINEIINGIVHYKTTAPDLTDNLQKALWDALEGLIFTNDGIICSMNNVQKIYGMTPGIIIHLKGI